MLTKGKLCTMYAMHKMTLRSTYIYMNHSKFILCLEFIFHGNEESSVGFYTLENFYWPTKWNVNVFANGMLSLWVFFVVYFWVHHLKNHWSPRWIKYIGERNQVKCTKHISPTHIETISSTQIDYSHTKHWFFLKLFSWNLMCECECAVCFFIYEQW